MVDQVPFDVIDQILSHAASDPDRGCVSDPTRYLSYGGLRDEILDSAAGLAALGVASGDRVVLYIAGSVDYVVMALACLYVGAIFVPLSTADPPMRTGAIVADADPRVVVFAATSHAPQLDPDRLAPFAGRAVRSASELRDLGAVMASQPPLRDRDLQRSAYIIYTSGTTGRPKGVLVGHRAFAAAVTSAASAFGMNQGTRAMCFSSVHFDGSFGIMFPALVSGGWLFMARRDSVLVPRMWVETVVAEQIDHTAMSPSFLRLLLGSRAMARIAESRLETMGLGGEAASIEDLRALYELHPGLRVFNRYGPTETTIAVTTFEITPEILASRPKIPIGQPHPGVSFEIVDDEGNALAGADAVGELFVGGDQLMQGYWRDPELTAEVLRVDPVDGRLRYRTGDLVTRDAWGDYVYLDRTDNVVKRNGVRISLEEISGALRELAPVVAATCIVSRVGGSASDAATDGPLEIAGCAAVEPGWTPPEIMRLLRDRLPATMLPDIVHLVEALPLTPAGKIDGVSLRSAVWPGT